VISLLLLLRRASRPRATELGRVPGTTYFADAVRHPENERIPDVFVFRPEASLVFFNVDHVRERFHALLAARGAGVRLVVVFMGTCPAVDLAGAELLEELHGAMAERGVAFRLAETRGEVRETLRRAGYERHGGPVAANQPVTVVVDEWREAGAARA
jgi:MFS superfamily sulfate permease-like transporter